MLTAARTALVPAIAFSSCLVVATSGFQAGGAAPAGLGGALTFHASFDNGPDADFGLGDRRIYTAESYKNRDGAKPGVHNPTVSILAGKGRHGAALEFKGKNTAAIYYEAAKNVDYRASDWSATVSFWLSLDPDQDLAGYADPIQITDKEYNNAAVWVDFTNTIPRPFRLGVFPDFGAWNPEKVTGQTNPAFQRHLVAVPTPPFGRGKWTHVAFTLSGLNAQQPGTARLYLDGKPQGTTGPIPEMFTLDPSKTTIRLGVNYSGLFDDLSIFNRALSDAEIEGLYGMTTGAAGLHR